MATKRGGDFVSSWVASGDLSTHQFKFVTAIGPVDVLLPTSGQFTVGVLQNKPRNDDHARILGAGYTKLLICGSLGQGAEVMAAPNGAVLANSGAWVGGFVLHACASGDIAEAFVNLRSKGSL